MNTPELLFATPTELIAALPHLLGFVPTGDMIALMLGAADNPAHVAMRAAIRCPITVDHEAAEQLPQTCRLDADQYPGAILVAVCDAAHTEHARSDGRDAIERRLRIRVEDLVAFERGEALRFIHRDRRDHSVSHCCPGDVPAIRVCACS